MPHRCHKYFVSICFQLAPGPLDGIYHPGGQPGLIVGGLEWLCLDERMCVCVSCVSHAIHAGKVFCKKLNNSALCVSDCLKTLVVVLKFKKICRNA